MKSKFSKLCFLEPLDGNYRFFRPIELKHDDEGP